MTEQQIQISVIVPIFRVERELPRCVDSLLRQTQPRIEIILVDDGSDDGCPALCDRYAAQDARIRVIHKPNGGLSDARNAGMAVMRGQWCMFVDSDDYLDTDACERLLAAAQKAGNADIVTGECEEHHGDTSVFQRHSALEEGRVFTASEYLKQSIPRGEFFMPVWMSIYQTDWLRAHRLRFAKGLLHEDMEWTGRVFLEGPLVTYMKGPFYHYVIREGSINNAKDFTKNATDCMLIYRQWRKQITAVSDPELRKLLNGFLCKCFIHTCASYQVKDGFKKSGITRRFLLRHSQSASDKLLAALFSVSPPVYFRLYQRMH